MRQTTKVAARAVVIDAIPALLLRLFWLVRAVMGSISVGAPMQTKDDLDWWEHRIENRIETDTTIAATDREAIIQARRGQGIFKDRVMQIEQHGAGSLVSRIRCT